MTQAEYIVAPSELSVLHCALHDPRLIDTTDLAGDEFLYADHGKVWEALRLYRSMADEVLKQALGRDLGEWAADVRDEYIAHPVNFAANVKVIRRRCETTKFERQVRAKLRRARR